MKQSELLEEAVERNATLQNEINELDGAKSGCSVWISPSGAGSLSPSF